MVTATGSKMLDAIVVEQFNRFRQRFMFTTSDEELDRVAKEIGCRSAADVRTAALFSMFIHHTERTGRWN